MRNPFKRDHDKDAKKVKEQLDRADYDGVSNEQIMAEDQIVDKLGIPTTWMQGDGPVEIRGRDTIVQPTQDDIRAFSRTGCVPNLCGQCKFFDLEKGRKYLRESGFAEKLTKDYEWNPAHLGAPIDTIGICGMSGIQTKTLASTMSRACDQFRAKGKYK